MSEIIEFYILRNYGILLGNEQVSTITHDNIFHMKLHKNKLFTHACIKNCDLCKRGLCHRYHNIDGRVLCDECLTIARNVQLHNYKKIDTLQNTYIYNIDEKYVTVSQHQHIISWRKHHVSLYMFNYCGFGNNNIIRQYKTMLILTAMLLNTLTINDVTMQIITLMICVQPIL